MSVHLVQCLCPQRHCIIALAYEHPAMSDAAAELACRRTMEGMVESGGINPWCGLCGSRELRYEAGKTRFATLEEALPQLAASQLAQYRTRLRLMAEKN